MSQNLWPSSNPESPLVPASVSLAWRYEQPYLVQDILYTAEQLDALLATEPLNINPFEGQTRVASDTSRNQMLGWPRFGTSPSLTQENAYHAAAQPVRSRLAPIASQEDIGRAQFAPPLTPALPEAARGHQTKRPRTQSITTSSSIVDVSVDDNPHAKYFLQRQFQRLKGLATYTNQPVRSVLQSLQFQRDSHSPMPDFLSKRPRPSEIPFDAYSDSGIGALMRREARKVKSLADTLDKPVTEVIHLLDLMDDGSTEDVASTVLEPEASSNAASPTASIDRFEVYARDARSKPCRARTSTTNPDGILRCIRPECNGAYDKKKKSSWLRHVQQMIPYELYTCPEPDCGYIDIRLEWIVNHLQNKHEVTNRDSAKARAKQRPYKVSFSGKCGWCDFQSNDWQEFFANHVYNHLTGEGGLRQATKHEWNHEYPPPPADTAEQHRADLDRRDMFTSMQAPVRTAGPVH